jgi:crossover junction endodeoxyribonuclease RuvC
MDKKIKKLDESDALAIAICHAFKLKTLAHKSSSWKDYILANPERIIE